MICKKIFISKERNVYFTTYLIENSKELHNRIKRPVIVICPGGGYSFLSDREAEPIALKYAAAGFHAVVLRYGINEHAVMPGPLNDIADTVAYLRRNAKKWYIDENQVFVTGFSAGAHVAASLGVFWNNSELLPSYGECPELIKPNGMLLCYPVLDLRSSATHMDIGIKPGADIDKIDFGQKHPKMPLEKIFVMDKTENRRFVNFEVAMNAYIFGGEYTDEQEDFYSLQNQVTKDTPPTFIWHTAKDGLIKPSNSILFANALNEHGVPYELHIFGEGDHGLSLGNLITGNHPWEICETVQPWIELAIAWINSRVL